MFLDEVKIFVASGKGGDGMVHFRREKYVPRGGPDGGDGGKGGDVVLVFDGRLNTLSTFRRKRHHRAEAGKPGGPNNRQGGTANDLELRVPGGTIAYDEESQHMLGELVLPEDRLVVCRGGRGGRGNARFASSRNRAPRIAERGEPGEERWIKLELRLIADVGIIGVPNAGKSTMLAAVTNATPKIADYPFTTLEPNLGVAELDDDLVMVLADIPGLIEGAHRGAGLGAEFLRHISRTRALVHLIDGAGQDPLADYSQVNAELALYEGTLGDKPQVVAVNKMDLPEAREAWPALEAEFKRRGVRALPVSGLAREGLRELLFQAAHRAESAEIATPDELPRYTPEPEAIEFEVRRSADGGWRLKGHALERAAAMTYWEYDEAVRRFQAMLQKLGVNDQLREAGVQDGDTVRIGEYELEWRE
jgi:GTP-binding protein